MRTQHMAIISSTYFPSSESYLPNTMVVLFNAPKLFHTPYPLMCVSKNSTTKNYEKLQETTTTTTTTIIEPQPIENSDITVKSLAMIRYAYDPIQLCNWTVYIATCNVAKNPIEFGIRDLDDSSQTIKLAHRFSQQPINNKKRSVVSCFSPLFYNEKWQLTLLVIELYRQLGVDTQVYYVQSILTEILEFMQIYEREKFIKIEVWDKIYLTEDESSIEKLGFDPNGELDWRNQASAHSDCLINFREEAEFVIISDIDDVLIPRLGKNYIEEFYFLMKLYPEASGFKYNRYNVLLTTRNDASKFSLKETLDTSQISNKWEDEKSVLYAAKVQSTWLHWPGIIDKGKMKTIPVGLNFMGHFRNWSTITDDMPMYIRELEPEDRNKHQMWDIISKEKINKLEKNFRKFLKNTPNATYYFNNLPLTEHYYTSFINCYNLIFYSKRRMPNSCPGPIRCQLPTIPNIRCSVGKRHYAHHNINSLIFVHYSHRLSDFIHSENGCYI